MILANGYCHCDIVYVVMSKERDTSTTNQSQKKGIYCTDVLFLFLFVGFTCYAVSIMDNVKPSPINNHIHAYKSV